MSSNSSNASTETTAKTLVVLVPDHRGNASALTPLKEMLIRETEFADAYWIEFDYVEPLWSNKSPEIIARSLGATIENFIYEHNGEINKVVLAGHSMGTALLRRAFLNASGFGDLTTNLSQQWAALVNRIVLMGAFGRGFDIAKQSFCKVRIWLRPIVLLGRIFGFGKMRLAMLVGSDFISRLRVDWIKFNGTNRPKPTVVHLLGSNDVAVNPVDVIDLEQFPNAIPVEVPNATHENIATPGQDTHTPLLKAFTGDPTPNRDVSIEDAADRVFFLLHGIRDSRECFKKINKKINNKLKEKCPQAMVVVPTYGFLSARSFLSTRYRNSFVPWFIDLLAEYLARNPKAEFYFAGHSNGTYILGEALKRIPRLSFTRIYLGASVLPAEFMWQDIVETHKQVKLVRSDMGSEDWPVGVLCRTLNHLGMKSLGPGGFDGFQFGDANHIVYNRFTGGHKAMLRNQNVDSIADFLLTGSPAEVASGPAKPPSSLFTVFMKYGDVLLPLALLIALVLLIGVAFLPVFLPTFTFAKLGPPFAVAVVVVAWIVMGRF